MIDINYSLRIAYYAALGGDAGMGGLPVFYQSVPPDVSPDEYIVFRSITNVDASTMNTPDVQTSMTVEIHTFANALNSGLAADQAAREVFNRIYPNPQGVLTLDGAQMVKTRLLNDVTQDAVSVANRAYISRFLTFGHHIYMRSDAS